MKNGPITLSKTPTAHVALVFVVIAVVGMLAFSNAIENGWCQRYEIPEYERLLGFRMGAINVPEANETLGLVWVDPSGPLGKAGIRAGDVPRMHHGLAEFCGELARVADRRPVEIEVMNVGDVSNGARRHRVVTVIGPRP